MKKYLLGILICININLFAHDQLLHQHITREAFKLLKKSFPNHLIDMGNYIGTNQVWSGNSADGSFGALKIVSGSYIEDEYDVVYGYGITRIPNYNQFLPIPTLISWFGGEDALRKAHTTITHFWVADNGPYSTIALRDNTHWGYWSFTIPENAMQKMWKYSNGLYDFIWAYKNGSQSWNWCAPNWLHIITKFDVPPITNFYKSLESFKAKSFFAEDGHWYKYLFEQMRTKVNDFHKNNLNIITFNYDRSQEHFFITALKNSYNLNDLEACEILKNISIIHLYGNLGGYPNLDTEYIRSFNPNVNPDIIMTASKGIKLMNEKSFQDDRLLRAQNIIKDSRYVCFLGFSYQLENFNYLIKKVKVDLGSNWNWRTYYGSAFDIKGGERQRIFNMFSHRIELGSEKDTILDYLRNNQIFPQKI